MRLEAYSFVVLVLVLLVGGTLASAAVNVVAATPELADIAKQIGGDNASVYSIAKPNQDYHMIEPRPSDVARIARAHLVVRTGLGLDLWIDSLVNAAGNPRVLRGGPGYVDASASIPVQEIPTTTITGASGDIHPAGNPHYFYDPQMGKISARDIMQGLKRVDARNASTYQANYDRFAKEIDRRTAAWQAELKPFRGRQVVIYHDSAVYFLRRFGLRQFGTLEVKPGIPPSASHVRDLIDRMKAEHVKAVVIESVYPHQFPDLAKRETGANYQVVPYSVGAMGTKSYFDLIEKWVQGYKEALQ